MKHLQVFKSTAPQRVCDRQTALPWPRRTPSPDSRGQAKAALSEAAGCVPPDYVFMQTALGPATGWTFAAAGSLTDAVAAMRAAAGLSNRGIAPGLSCRCAPSRGTSIAHANGSGPRLGQTWRCSCAPPRQHLRETLAGVALPEGGLDRYAGK